MRFYSPPHGGIWCGRRGRDSHDHRAVEYARWIAQRDGAELPGGRIIVERRRGPDGQQRPCAVTFGAVRVAIPHWDYVERPPHVEYEADVNGY